MTGTIKPCAYLWTGPSGRVEYNDEPTCSVDAASAGWRAAPLYDQQALDAAVAQERADAERYRTILANIETLVLRTEKGSTLTLTAKHRGAEFTRSGMDATLDGLGAAICASKEPS